jgi:putative protein kinase ArgK-like GTPase of G3E family
MSPENFSNTAAAMPADATTALKAIMSKPGNAAMVGVVSAPGSGSMPWLRRASTAFLSG